MSKIICDTLFTDDCIEVVADVVENRSGVELLSDVPIVSYAVSFLKIRDFFRDRWLFRKMAIFIERVNKGFVSEEERTQAIDHFFESEENSKRELEYLVLILDRYVEEEKAGLLALVYCEFIRGNIDLNLLKIFAEAISRFLPGDCETLRNGECFFNKSSDVSECFLRLASLGLMQKIVKIINDSKDVAESKFQEGSAITPYENALIFKYTLIGLKLRTILFPAVKETEGIVTLDMSLCITMV